MKLLTITGIKNLLLILSVLFALSLFLFYSCTSTAASLFDTLNVRITHYENPEYSIALDYPADWYFKEQDGLFFATVSGFDIALEEGAGLAVLRYPEKDLQSEFKNMTLDKLIESFMNEIEAGYKDKGEVIIGGIDAHQAGFTIMQEKKISGKISVLIVNGYIYFFMIMGNPPSLMTEYKQVFDAIYESIEFMRKEELAE